MTFSETRSLIGRKGGPVLPSPRHLATSQGVTSQEGIPGRELGGGPDTLPPADMPRETREGGVVSLSAGGEEDR